MPTTDELTTFLIERVQALDPSLDVSSGSPAYTHLITPLLAKLGTDPFETPIQQFLLARLKEEHPTLDVRETDVLMDTLVNPLSSFLEPFKRELESIRLSQTITDPSAVAEGDIDALLSNLFFTRVQGQKATATVRMYFAAPASISITPLTQFSTASGLRFLPILSSSITADTMLLNQEGSLFFFDTSVQAEQEGTGYNVGIGEISSVTGVPAITRVTNLTAVITPGINRETNLEFVTRADVALSERTLNTERGLSARLMDLFNNIRAIQAIGYRDVEMERDILTGSLNLTAGDLGLGPPIQSAQAASLKPFTITVGGIVLGDDSNVKVGRWDQDDLESPFTSVPQVGNIMTVIDVSNADPQYNNGVPRQHTIGGSAANPTLYGPLPTLSDVYFDDYSWVGTYGIDGLTTVYDVSAYPPATANSGTEGADLPFTNIFQTAATDFLGASGTVSEGDNLFVQKDVVPPIVQTGVSVVTSVMGNNKLRFGPELTLVQVGDNATSRPAYIQQAIAGIKIGIANVVDLLNPDITGKAIVLRLDDGTLVTDGSGRTFFRVESVNNVSDSLGIAGWKTVTLDAEAVHAGPTDDAKWSVVDADPNLVGPMNPRPSLLDAQWLPAETEGGTSYVGSDVSPFAFAFRRTKAGITLADDVGIPTSITEQTPLSVSAAITASDLTISGIPGGIAYPSTPEGEITINNNQVHIGGHTDAFLLPADQVANTLAVALEDDDPVIIGTLGSAVPATSTLTDENASFVTNGAQAGDILVLKDGDPGSYRITSVTANTLVVINHADPEVAAFVNGGATLRYEVVRLVEVDLVAPKDTKIPNTRTSPRANPTDLITSLSSELVTTAGALDFTAAGVEADDILEIKTGLDKGVHTITSVQGAGNSELVLLSPLSGGQTGLEYTVYKLDAAGGVIRPILRVSKVELLGPNSEPTGQLVPLADPVDVRSSDFANRGEGTKIPNSLMAGNDIITTPASDLITIEAASTGNFMVSNVVPGDVINWTSGPNINKTRIVLSVDTIKQLTLEADNTQELVADPAVTVPVTPSTQPNMGDYTIGAPSVGTARCYFLDPTSFGVDANTLFTVADSVMTFRPDPANFTVLYDPDLPPAGTPILAPAGDYLEWSTQYRSVKQLGLQVGDYVEIGYGVIQTSGAPAGDLYPDGASLHGKTLTVTEYGVGTHTVTFSGTNPIPVTSSTGSGGILEQLKAQLPASIHVAHARFTATATDYFYLSSKNRITIPTSAEAPLGAGTPLGLVGKDSWLADLDVYEIFELSPGDAPTPERTVRVRDLQTPPQPVEFAVSGDRHLRFIRKGVQRISSTDMATTTEDGLYYFDVQLISSAAGNIFNISDETRMTITGHQSDGYRLATANSATTYSTAEELTLRVEPSILRVGDDDELVNKTFLPGTSVQITYERSETVSSAQDILFLDGERVVNNNPLARHYLPAYVRFEFQYSGGSIATVIKEDLVSFINNLPPDTALEAFDLHVVARDRGASFAREPLVMIAVAHQKDRSVRVYRSENRISLVRNEHFIAEEDFINVLRG